MKLRFPACSISAGRRIETIVVINDFTGVTLATLNRKAFDLIQFGLKTANDFYPETLHRCYITGVPYVFYGIWAIIKNFLDEKTLRKVSIMGSDFTATLLEAIDADFLPDFLGGNCNC